MSIKSQSGNPPIQSAPAEISPYHRAVFDTVLPYSSGENPMDTALIDDQDILLSNLSGQLAMLQSMAANVSTGGFLEINASDFIGYVDSLERQLSIIKAVNAGIASQLCDLRKHVSNLGKLNKNEG